MDAVIRGTKSTALVERKFTEPDGGACSQTRRRKLANGQRAAQCNGSYVEQINPVASSGSETALCALTAKGIRYWEFIPSVFHLASDVAHEPCPFARGEYQWMRNLVAAKALALQTGRPHSFVIAYVDGPFHMPRKLQSDEWRAFRSRVREEVPIAAISFQRLIAVARSASSERDSPTLEALGNWVDKKVERSLPNNRLQPTAPEAMRSRRGRSGDVRQTSVLKYIELKSGHCDDGPAWIARVKVSKSGRTIYFNGRALKQGSVGAGNFFDMTTGEAFWVSGVKRDGSDRHWAGAGKVFVEATAVDEYLALVGRPELDRTRFVVTYDIQDTDPAAFVALENKPL